MKDKHILILEDEQPAGEKLLQLINKSDIAATVEWRRSVVEGLAFLNNHKNQIDLIFSDIQLLDGNSFDIFKQAEPQCPIIFCTAFDNYFLEAFESKGIAYLLKPYSEAQFLAAIKKYSSLFESDRDTTSVDLQALAKIIHQESKRYKQTFTVKKQKGVFLLTSEDIVYIQAQGDFVLAFDANGKKHLISQNLSSISEVLDPAKFFQINRSEIIQHQYIHSYEVYTKNRLAIQTILKDKLYTSNSRAAEFKRWLENS